MATDLERQHQKTIEFLNRKCGTRAKKKVVEKPCPPCPECEEQIVKVKTLTIKDVEDIDLELGKKSDCGIKKHKKMTQGKCLVIRTGADDIPSQYAITELSFLRASHDPNANFAKNPSYPAECQKREYHSNEQLQGNVLKRSKSLQPDMLVNTTPSPEDGPPIINPAGIVLGGNSRTMMLQYVDIENKSQWNKYHKYLQHGIQQFGLTKSDLEKYEKPVLVRVIEVDEKTACAYLSRIFNTSTRNEEDVINRALSATHILTKSQMAGIAEVISKSNAGTLSEIFQNKNIQDVLLLALRKAGILTDSNAATYYKTAPNGYFMWSNAGVNTASMMLLAYILKERDYVEATISLRMDTKLLQSLSAWLQIALYPKEWNITPSLQRALFESYINRKTYNDDVDSYLNSTQMFEGIETKALSKIEIMLMKMLAGNSKKSSDGWTSKEFREVLENYVRVANNYVTEEDNAFGKTDITAEQVLHDSMELVKNGRKESRMLSDKKSRPQRKVKRKLADKPKPKTLLERIKSDLKTDWNRLKRAFS